ncbi:MAG: hypothetical protein CFE45_02760 [Burkholderiales bacterium PBB5]|nr:MAG: hypothetical protein CFE45_02760 [Burkholderiales bacterium PBB5]
MPVSRSLCLGTTTGTSTGTALVMATATALLLALGSQPAAAQSAPPPPPAPPAAVPIGFANVAQALAALRARDGNGTIVTEADGWVTVNEPLAAAQWSFTPAGHEAHPAVVRRIIQRGPAQAISVDLALLCEAPAAACQRLRQQFEALNDRIVQALKSRGRGGSTPPPPAAQ